MMGEGLGQSKKSVALASAPQLRSDLRQKIKEMNLPVRVETKARDLGIDFTSGARRQGVITARQKTGSQRARAVKFLGRVAREASKFAKTGHKPQVSWGAVAIGLAPTTLRQFRAQMSAMCGSRCAGGCATTAIRIRLGKT
eukprot:368553-Pyramimonas_sp.AAC.1